MNLGTWSSWASCPTGYFAKAYSFRIGNDPGGDKFGVMDMTLTCNDASSTQIQGATFNFAVGTTSSQACANSGRLSGFLLLKGVSSGTDTFGAYLINMICEDGITLLYDYNTDCYWQLCPQGSYVCGLRVQIQDYMGTGNFADDTGLNNVDMKCCLPVNAVSFNLKLISINYFFNYYI